MDEGTAARDAALRLLAHADRSEAEVRRRLARGGFGQDQIDDAVGFLHRAGLLDDARLARQWTESRGERRLVGPRRIEAELRHKGVDPEIVREALSGLTEEQILASALAFARRRSGGRAPDDPDARRRLRDALVRRGFGWETIEQVMAALEANT